MAKANSTATITAYGSKEDHERLKVLAKREGTTVSKCLLKLINSRYEKLYGNTPPEVFTKS